MTVPALDGEALRAWLLVQDEVVGEACESRGCPLAQYLSSMTGQVYWVSEDVYGVADCWRLLGVHDHTKCIGMLPVWARAFVRGVDAVCLGAVSSTEALAVLDRVLRDTA